ncbi:MAG: hypothetical protein VSS75_013620 [Candidatus Parabeggiatoa sp.]|nr:hypothetical protein [Candidatus Parabeggiatoa sp.]
MYLAKLPFGSFNRETLYRIQLTHYQFSTTDLRIDGYFEKLRREASRLYQPIRSIRKSVVLNGNQLDMTGV